MCSGRDVLVSVEGNFLEFEVQFSALEKNVPQFLVATNCGDDRFKKLHTPEAVRFKYPLPADVIPNGKHTMLVDPSGEYFGIKLQKISKFQNQVMVQSKRSLEKEKVREEEIKKKLQLGTQFLDDKVKLSVLQNQLRELLEKNDFADGNTTNNLADLKEKSKTNATNNPIEETNDDSDSSVYTSE